MNKYKVIRQILFYAAGQEVTLQELGKFYTRKAIEEFIKFNFIKEK